MSADPNNYSGTDSEKIEAALRFAKEHEEPLMIPARKPDERSSRNWWLLDRAILIPGDTTVIIRNCKLKLSDSCRDNFFRSANCGIGIDQPKPIRNIRIIGEGAAVLEGADHPRSTGDHTKILACPCPKNFSGADVPAWDDLHAHTYGTDAGKKDCSQYGDWRSISILMAATECLTIENLRIGDSHAWGISLEACSHARIAWITFQACMTRIIDGMKQNVENQDGIDLRNGCHHIIITDIMGTTGEDIVALTAIDDRNPLPGGSIRSTHVMTGDFAKRDGNISNVIVRNILGYPAGGCCHVRLLAVNTRIENVLIDGIVDTSPSDFHAAAAVLLGEPDEAYGPQKNDSIAGLTVSNVISNANYGVILLGYLKDALIQVPVNRNEEGKAFFAGRKDAMRNVRICQ